ncbi:MAG: hypothetical protein U0K81_00085 [Paludibacteraceae bacterium]|jgi:hypothetical protein|nr:hypothetical protein [Paludibacteraceae bacterium]
MKEYLKRTWKNKALALFLLAVNLGILLLTMDATTLVMMLPIILALLFAKKDYVDMEGRDHDE